MINANSLKSFIAPARIFIIKNAPKILLTLGVVGSVTSTVLACKATTKVEKILQEAQKDIKDIQEVSNSDEYKDEYSPEDKKKDTVITYVKHGVNIAKAYAPAIGVGFASIACIIGSHGILNNRNIALSSGYAMLNNAYKAYRKRVAENYGEETEKNIFFGTKATKVEKIIEDADGKKKKVKEEVNKSSLKTEEFGPFTKLFGVMNHNWSSVMEYNLNFLLLQQSYFNRILSIDKVVFLNDVYERLGIAKTRAGQIAGWVDGQTIDFGLYKRSGSGFVNDVLFEDNNDNDALVLDFNAMTDVLSVAALRNN